MSTIQLIAAVLFGLALLHTFAAKSFEALAHRHPRHAGLFHLLGEVEVVFGFWAVILIVAMALVAGGQNAIAYAESRQYTEPLFVFVVMVVAASWPVLNLVQRALRALARMAPLRAELALVWLGLALVPLAGSLITEPAAMTLAALILAPLLFRQDAVPEWLKYAALGVLFVNISIGGTLTAYAAPPVLMVAATWQWDSAFMLGNFGWKAALAVVVNATVVGALLGRHLPSAPIEAAGGARSTDRPVPLVVALIHLAFLAAVVLLAHHPVLFLGVFLLFLGFTQAYQRHQHPLILKEGLLVGFFLAGLVILGGMQQWWLQPIVSGLEPVALFFGALALTAITDNAALTYLGSLIEGMSARAQYMLVAGAVAGGGLTVIANAPNPAGVSLLRRGFRDESIGALGLLLGALPPTAVAALAFFL
ncbi:putative Na+/H+ antiporter [Pseudoduganella namucuonensis]|uniref:Putative Na+/H+ antiporter n=1 Tax=Pseudoduganella namucuonensis TaxID=1035707 RepID=A0A1I7M324_9BURK|nr:putative Na+/H+ antiporter [Pseudoduganella namucuonensis]SFV16344.1 Putative Na+/H+ antiporter [Pseudoduganella namucuonensis]